MPDAGGGQVEHHRRHVGHGDVPLLKHKSHVVGPFPKRRGVQRSLPERRPCALAEPSGTAVAQPVQQTPSVLQECEAGMDDGQQDCVEQSHACEAVLRAAGSNAVPLATAKAAAAVEEAGCPTVRAVLLGVVSVGDSSSSGGGGEQ